jgi:hypothetical protein
MPPGAAKASILILTLLPKCQLLLVFHCKR